MYPALLRRHFCVARRAILDFWSFLFRLLQLFLDSILLNKVVFMKFYFRF
uniref:Uncharacterized protein n=1 Tax=Myoviridae sp. ct2AC8 TaxID=2827655 RepID=A0A8S5TPY7_9CAUD|nr:MAG TPA: hypothetical protein [Myoviridae sp. ct2AC8]